MPRAAVFAAMRNEGPFVLEWVAYHQILGFDRVIIASNDCTDGTDTLLEALAQAGEITHLPHSVPQGMAPQDNAMAVLLEWIEGQDYDWLLHIDADEFLNLEADLPALLALGEDADVIALRWKFFGDNGHKIQPPTTLPNFTACEDICNPETVKFKSFFRPRTFAHAYDHMPTLPRKADAKVVSAAGLPLDPSPLYSTDSRFSRYRPLDLSLAKGLAHINHYATRSEEAFTYRQARGDGQGKDGQKYRLNSRWHKIANRNEARDTSILRHWPATLANISRLRQIKGVLDAERQSLAYFMAATGKVAP